MTTAIQFARQRKVVEDAEDGLDDAHRVRVESSKEGLRTDWRTGRGFGFGNYTEYVLSDVDRRGV